MPSKKNADEAVDLPGRPHDPLDEPRSPNIRLAHTRKGSYERALWSGEHGDWYPALAHWRADGVEYELPVTAKGEPDVAQQREGWYDPYAHRIAARCPHYVLITEKGA